mmetsp:Transcript_88236/g.248389  ORF Transcript_88236/g.248389 Transcript_88236/m.248389 type:complete len:274 (-) Transcript_88236:118-939(-)
MESRTELVAVTKLDGGVYHVELDRPKSRNALSWALWLEIREVFQALQTNNDCRAIVLSGRGKSFCAGLDVTDPGNMPPPSEDVARKALRFITHTKTMQDAVSAIESCLKPTIAAIHGACVGAGVDVVTAVDVRVCSSDARFSIREAAVGLAADVGTLARLPKVVGNDSLVRELALTARDFSAEEAKSFGLVSRVLPTQEDTLEEAKRIAAMIAVNSPVAVVGTKKNLNFARDHSIQDSLDYVLTWNSAMIQSEDFTKAMGAAMQQKKPEFSKL